MIKISDWYVKISVSITLELTESLEDYFIKQNLICISDVDTRVCKLYKRQWRHECGYLY
jgi:carbamoylphosphate synthase small subunit